MEELTGVIDIIQIFLALILVFLNGIFVAAEFAFVRARPTRIAQLAKQGDSRARVAQRAMRHLDAYLSVCQLGITLASLGLGWLGEPAIADLLTPLLKNWGIQSMAVVHTISFTIAFAIITFLHVVLGELAPKTLAIQQAEKIVLLLARPMRLFYVLFYPGVITLNGTANFLLRLIGLKNSPEHEQTHTEEELRMLINASYKGGHIDKSEQELLQNVFRFEQKVARDVMVPRPETVFLYLEDSLAENFALARKAGHTRFPVCEETPDHVVGLIHIKDLFLLDEQDDFSMKDIMREIHFIPEGMPLDQLLHCFQKTRQHMAVVVDEYGGCAGIVTMENLLEQLVGDIRDEFDQDETDFIRYQDGLTLVSGRILLEEAQQYFDLSTNEEDEEYSTLGGFLFGKLGKPPKKGDSVTIGDLRLEVVEVKGMRIDQIKITPRQSEKSKV